MSPIAATLTRIKQLGLSSAVYPGAQHTRFQHSLGAFHLMSETIKHLTAKGNFIFDSEAEAVQAAILLHDIGHGPFSHVLENTLVGGVSHEEISLMLMERIKQGHERSNSILPYRYSKMNIPRNSCTNWSAANWIWIVWTICGVTVLYRCIRRQYRVRPHHQNA